METAGNPSLPAAVEKEPVAHDAAHEEIGPPKGISTKLLKHLHDADAAMKAFEGLDGQVIELTEEKSKAILRRIDWHLMPIMCLIYGLNYLDKTTLSYASSMGLKLLPSDNKLQSDIGLTGDQ